ncbi:hypothetical protein LguiA_017319 [Lonicera macranthoides]
MYNPSMRNINRLMKLSYDPLDPNGNITIKWDIETWTPDGYIAIVTLFNYQLYRHIQAPGWSVGWAWARNEVIWDMRGRQTTERGDCSQYKGTITHCCNRAPTIVDLMPEAPYNQQLKNCCKGGILSSLLQFPANSVSSNLPRPASVVPETTENNYAPLVRCTNDTALLYGVKSYNDLLMQARPTGYVQSKFLGFKIKLYEPNHHITSKTESAKQINAGKPTWVLRAEFGKNGKLALAFPYSIQGISLSSTVSLDNFLYDMYSSPPRPFPYSIQGISLSSTVSLDNFLYDMYSSPPRPLPHDANPRVFRMHRDGSVLRREK